MAKQTGKSSVSGKFGKQFNKAKENEVDYGSTGDLPGTIEMGIAKLTSCRFGVYKSGDNAGEYFFYASGVVQSPEEANMIDKDGNVTGTMRIKGLATKIGPEPICDTPNAKGKKKTAQDHIDWVVNEFKKLGVETDDIDFSEEGMAESVAKMLEESKPLFRFRTWQGKATPEYPNPRVTHEWKGACKEGEVTINDDDGVVDASPEAEPEVEKPAPRVAAKPGAKPGVKAKPAPEPEPEPEPESAEVDLDALVELAGGDDDDEDVVNARAKLGELATEAGVSDDDIAAAESWEELAGLIRLGTDDTTDEGDASADDWKPGVDETYKFKPIDPKTKKPGKAVECDVVAVQEEAQTVHVKIAGKLYSDPKTKKAKPVKWTELESA